jgi:transcriptional regulator with PAS, ATPase and Fis domain
LPVNVASLNDDLFSAMIFGYKKGAFTSAHKNNPGLIETAENGTIFLDEIGDLSPLTQIKLLELVDKKEYCIVGDNKNTRTNVRILAATNRPLEQLKDPNCFRQDLYHRLMAHHIHLSPLRERREDIPLLTDYLIAQAAETLNKKIPTPHPSLYKALQDYPFSGNIRELELMIYDAVLVNRRKYLIPDVFRTLQQTPRPTTYSLKERFAMLQVLPTVKQLKEGLVNEALLRTKGKKSQAAKMLGITLQALSKRLAQRRKQDAETVPT